ncbi:hypothetical protein Poli38472_011749 [Pythium oligandrum]|uniref:RNA methyltransferase n=1 Tax=Pythium oligandrum TaxID=41045 RepID=A0A8K1C7N1_PYTOL|nr:hypothetical protein Poli38472_011749 [Pythium oligandrum]|eukprot:TMW58161.1 hypothetical protein Poli38472_011749 [Pythium oligandrum]
MRRWTTPLVRHGHARSVCTAASQLEGAAAATHPQAKRTITATITSLDEDGDAIGYDASAPVHTNRPLRVPFAVPGDTLAVQVWNKDLVRSDFTSAMFAQLETIEQPSEHRVEPLCSKFFGICGGCKHQNVRYAEQLEQKQRRVESMFTDRGIPVTEPIRRIQGVESEGDAGLYRYRNKMEFTCSTGRWMLDDDKTEDEEVLPEFTLGLFPVASVSTRRARTQKKRRNGRHREWNSRILSIDSCVLQDASCDWLLQRIRSLCEELNIKAYDFHTHDGFLKNVVLRRGTVGDDKEIMVGFVTTTLEGETEQQQRLNQLVETLVRDFDLEQQTGNVVSIVQQVDEEALRHRRETAAEKQRVLFGRDFMYDSILGHHFEVSLDSFFQPNSTQASQLYRVIQEQIVERMSEKKPIVWDLFCGVGSIGICMGPHVERLIGFEIVDAAVEKARKNAEINGYTAEQMQFRRLDLSNHWSEVESQLLTLAEDPATRPDLIIVDPPRAGLHKKLITLLTRLAPAQICYVSCNPETQVRDLELLCCGETAPYSVEMVQPVDMLPHTPHLETVAWLERRHN